MSLLLLDPYTQKSRGLGQEDVVGNHKYLFLSFVSSWPFLCVRVNKEWYDLQVGVCHALEDGFVRCETARCQWPGTTTDSLQ